MKRLIRPMRLIGPLGLIGLIGLTLIVLLLSSKIRNDRVNFSLAEEKTLPYQQALKDSRIADLNSLFELPKDEPVKFGVIKDQKTLAKVEPFFKKAQNGQLLLIYKDLTIIYDPASKTIVDMARVELLK